MFSRALDVIRKLINEGNSAEDIVTKSRARRMAVRAVCAEIPVPVRWFVRRRVKRLVQGTALLICAISGEGTAFQERAASSLQKAMPRPFRWFGKPAISALVNTIVAETRSAVAQAETAEQAADRILERVPGGLRRLVTRDWISKFLGFFFRNDG